MIWSAIVSIEDKWTFHKTKCNSVALTFLMLYCLPNAYSNLISKYSYCLISRYSYCFQRLHVVFQPAIACGSTWFNMAQHPQRPQSKSWWNPTCSLWLLRLSAPSIVGWVSLHQLVPDDFGNIEPPAFPNFPTHHAHGTSRPSRCPVATAADR